ncbi:conjugal transfer protein [Acrocarpospora pleiomorpha]|uniref:conjugal transfer protein n=1 Tax=Acrocarpospora pleiomorpha TaxID=90975 RepID=UPI0012D3121F|nr:conjugal transfer protein [Acrocarpospora pleiomorpha]
MARRSTVQQDPRIAGDPESYPLPDLDSAPVRRRGWSGGGGRWLVWVGRAILWALIIVIVVNGVRAPFERFTQGQNAAAPTTPEDAGFPVQEAAGFASQFAAVYLNFDATNPDQRDERLTAFLPLGGERRFGWNGYGRMSAGAIQFQSIDVAADNVNATVVVSFQSGSKRWLLSVPVYHSGDRFVVTGRPALLPAPAVADLPAVADPDRDNSLENQLRPTLEGFFKAYASGNTAELRLYATDGATIEGLGGSFELAQLTDVIVPVGGESSRTVTAVVVWAVPSGAAAAQPSTDPAADPAAQSAGLEQAYQLSMERQGEKWLVGRIQGAGRSVG